MAPNDVESQNLKTKLVDGILKLTLSQNGRIAVYDELLDEQNYLYKKLPEELADSIIENIEQEHLYKMSTRFDKKLQEEKSRLSKEIEILENEEKILKSDVDETEKRIIDLENRLTGTNEEIKELEEQNMSITKKFSNEIQKARHIFLSQNNKN